jgi:hypothetical protein
MLNRRSVLLGSLSLGLPRFIRVATAEANRPMLVFVGHEL